MADVTSDAQHDGLSAVGINVMHTVPASTRQRQDAARSHLDEAEPRLQRCQPVWQAVTVFLFSSLTVFSYFIIF